LLVIRLRPSAVASPTLIPVKLSVAAIGSRPRPPFEALAQLYLDRMAELLPGSDKKSVDAPLFRSEEALLATLDRERARTAPLLVLLDERGRSMTSEAFAQWFGRERDEGRQRIIFAIGPADGWSEEARRRAGLLFSLGPMTLAHELARIVLCEQIYRALTLLAGHPYHRGNRD
jgi:23S rRNA (pseudouridine1915-N3)-methyltransferase